MASGTEVKYVTTTSRVVRGMEARTIKKWEADGWELVSQTPGKIRSEITFRRPKPKSRPLPWIIGGGAFVVALATIITIGIINERNAAPAESAEPAPPAASATPTDVATPVPTPDDNVCDVEFSSTCTFGQTAIYSDSTSDGELVLEITVLPPVEFAPSDGATFFDSFANQQAAKPVNIYFPVTIKNISPSLVRDASFVFTNATNVDEGESEVLTINDGEIRGYVSFEPLAPGDAYTFNNGWSMSTLSGIELSVDIDGLAGYSITFSE